MLTPRPRSSSGTPSGARLGGDALVQIGARRAARFQRRADDGLERHARHLDRILHREEQPALRALPGRQPEELVAVDRDRTARHLVLAAAHERVRQRRLARTVRAHQRVHLAGADLEVDAAQDLVPRRPSRADRRCAARGRRSVRASRQHHRDVVAVDLDRVDGDRLRRGQRLRLAGDQARTSSRASGTRSRARPPTRRPRRASSRRASTGRRSRRSRRRCARRRCDARRRRSGPRYRARCRRRRAEPHECTHHRLARACSSLSTTERRRPLRERADREPLEHVVEESEHDQSLGLLGRDAARLEVVELLVVDRADRRRVRAAHVVGLDLEVRDRLRARALGEHEVAVRLRRVRLLRGRRAGGRGPSTPIGRCPRPRP